MLGAPEAVFLAKDGRRPCSGALEVPKNAAKAVAAWIKGLFVLIEAPLKFR
jgi:hypothetical protein